MDQTRSLTVLHSVTLPFVSAPLIWFTARNSVMTVRGQGEGGSDVGLRNGYVVTVIATLLWVLVAVMNIALLVLTGMGKE